jgi:hypothetical protein
MCPACIAIAGLVATVFRPWRARRKADRDAAAAAWRRGAAEGSRPEARSPGVPSAT